MLSHENLDSALLVVERKLGHIIGLLDLQSKRPIYVHVRWIERFIDLCAFT